MNKFCEVIKCCHSYVFSKQVLVFYSIITLLLNSWFCEDIAQPETYRRKI